jgi:mannose-1-phosphate guanylyltransferase
MNTIKELYDYREMIFSLVRRDLKGRYKGSVLGFLWTFLNPLLQLGVYTMVLEEYLWNSGMFVWKVSSILKNIKQFMPETYAGLLKIKNAIKAPEEENVLEKEFYAFPSDSIDYAVMEKAQNIYTLPGTFGWDDVGSWLAVERIRKTNEYGNVISGNIITINSHNCIIEGTKKLIAVVGLENLIIVDSEDATLICEKESAGDIKKVLENLKICNRNEYI